MTFRGNSGVQLEVNNVHDSGRIYAVNMNAIRKLVQELCYRNWQSKYLPYNNILQVFITLLAQQHEC